MSSGEVACVVTAASVAATGEQVEALRRTGLLDSRAEASFDRLTGLVCRLLRVPVSLVSLVDSDRQFFKSARGLPEPWASRRETPLSHSFCQYVVGSGQPLVVEDAREDPVLCDNLAIRDLDVVAYLGLPLRTPDGTTIGSLCAIDHQPRIWTEEEVSIVSDLAASVMTEVAAAIYAREREEALCELQALNETLEERVRTRTRALERVNGELEGRNQELQEFAFVASHDLREPLRKVSTFADLLLAEYGPALGADGTGLLSRIHASSVRMQALLDGLLSFSRISTGSLTLRRTDLRDAADAALETLRLLVEETGASVEIGELPTALVDADQWQRLLTNLVENALKYHRDGVPPAVVISADGTGEEGEHRISVCDNGIGFDTKYTRRIFLPFERLHGHDDYPGTGMGLTICRRIAERHGGRLEVTSTPGKGSCFTVIFPADGQV